VLTKEPKGRDVGEEDVFTLNEGFRNKGIRVKLSAVSSQKEGEAEHIETRQKVRGACLLLVLQTMQAWKPRRLLCCDDGCMHVAPPQLHAPQ
jgi:hypothetical protein